VDSQVLHGVLLASVASLVSALLGFIVSSQALERKIITGF